MRTFQTSYIIREKSFMTAFCAFYDLSRETLLRWLDREVYLKSDGSKERKLDDIYVENKFHKYFQCPFYRKMKRFQNSPWNFFNLRPLGRSPLLNLALQTVHDNMGLYQKMARLGQFRLKNFVGSSRVNVLFRMYVSKMDFLRQYHM